jgi:hypothetical protein
MDHPGREVTDESNRQNNHRSLNLESTKNQAPNSKQAPISNDQKFKRKDGQHMEESDREEGRLSTIKNE